MIGKLRNSLERVLPRRESRLSLERALAKWSHREIATVLDIGASDGRWSRRAMRYLPGAAYLLFEAQGGPHRERLEAFKRGHPGVEYVIAAAGNREGTIHFDAESPFGGVAAETPFERHDIEVPVTTVDAAVARRGLRSPFLLKLDAHGFEVPILEGAAVTLPLTALIVIEVYNFRLCEGALRFHEMCAYLEERGFRPLDLFDVVHREKDGALWQFDLLLGRSGDSEFASNTYE
jgi:FkbM family methyltransferase